MIKPFIIASAFAAAIVGAVSIASANNSIQPVVIKQVAGLEPIQQTGIVNCTDQVWPSIDAYCLKPASDRGELRQARQINM